ncbi:MAG: T9SS type A sorting domain-containing protein [Bacteroidales bacterium]|nr:T9SS type A sorting domain-containing protein [Bacteroidales bacterium]
MLFNDGQGNFQEDPITSIKKTNNDKPYEFSNYPNPFHTELSIKYNIIEKSFVEISVFDLTGGSVKVLTNKQQKGGEYLIKWDGLNNGGKTCKPGPYLLTFKVNGIALQTIKLLKI